MANQYTGVIPVKIGQKSYDLQYRYEGLMALRAEFGVEFRLVINAAVNTIDVETISKFISIGIGGQLTAEEIFKISPPIVPMVEAIRVAFNCANHGSKEQPEENPTRGAKLKKALTLLLSPWKWLSVLG